MRKRAFVLVVVVLSLCAVLFAGCNFKQTYPSVNEIYQASASGGQITGAELQVVLPEGWEVFTSASKNYSSHKDSDTGYIPSIDAYVVTNTSLDVISLVRTTKGTGKTVGELIIPSSYAIQAVHVVGDLVSFRRMTNGIEEYGVFDKNGKVMLNSSKTENTSTSTLTSAIRVLGGGLVAVNPAYDKATVEDGKTGYTPIYSAGTGELVCRVKNPGGSLLNMYGFDGRYISVEYSDSSKGTSTYIYDVQSAGDEVVNLDPPAYGSFENAGGLYSNFYSESLYLGGGKFYVHQEWTVDSDEDYTYHYDGDYAKVVRYIYNAANDTKTVYSSPYIFINLVSPYYDNDTDYLQVGSPYTLSSTFSYASGGMFYDSSSKSFKIEPEKFIKDGYAVAFFGLYVPASKEAEFDQFVIDRDLNVVMSLTGNIGVKVDGAQDRDKIGYYDLVMQTVGGYTYSAIAPSELRVYDGEGSLVFSKSDRDFVTVAYQDGIFVTSIMNSEGDVLYGGYDEKGNLVIDFKYSYIEPFRGFYTYAVTAEGSKRVLLGKDGGEVAAMSDGTAPFANAATSNSKPILKRGCYITKATVNGTTYFGVSNYDVNVDNAVVIPSELTSCTIYIPNADNNSVYVFGQYESGGQQYVYKLTGTESFGAGSDGKLSDGEIAAIVVCSVIGAGAIVAVAVVVSKKKKAKKAE